VAEITLNYIHDWRPTTLLVDFLIGWV